MWRGFLLIFLLCDVQNIHAQVDFSFDDLFKKYASSFDSIIDQKKDYRVQIAYTQIDRNSSGVPTTKSYTFDADKYYYYCASTIKLPATIFCLEKFNKLSKYGVSILDSFDIKNTACANLSLDNLWLKKSPRNFSCLLKNLLIISDNNAFNPIYDFVTPIGFIKRFDELGFKDAVIAKRFAKCDLDENQRANSISFFDENGVLKMEQASFNLAFLNRYSGSLKPFVGKSYLDNGLVKKPFDFTNSNYIRLSDLHQLMQWVILDDSSKLKLRSSDFLFLKNTLHQYPRTLALADFEEKKYPDNYMKFFWRLDSGQYVIPERFKIYNKVGQAYGFLTDCMYFKDEVNDVEFLLSASIYVNKNETLNDGKYEYETTGFPFLQNLFAAIYNEEVGRRFGR